MISTKAKTPPAMIEFRINGIVIRRIVECDVIPKERLHAIKLGGILVNPEETEPYPTA